MKRIPPIISVSLGIVWLAALHLLRPGTRIVTISVVDAWSDSLRNEDRARADFVDYVGE